MVSVHPTCSSKVVQCIAWAYNLVFVMPLIMQVLVKGPQRLNPGIAMSEEVIAIHGITDADVADCPRCAH